jgi:hypothetical protein
MTKDLDGETSNKHADTRAGGRHYSDFLGDLQGLKIREAKPLRRFAPGSTSHRSLPRAAQIHDGSRSLTPSNFVCYTKHRKLPVSTRGSPTEKKITPYNHSTGLGVYLRLGVRVKTTIAMTGWGDAKLRRQGQSIHGGFGPYRGGESTSSLLQLEGPHQSKMTYPSARSGHLRNGHEP